MFKSLIAVDVEANGLLGQPFAVAGVVLAIDGQQDGQFGVPFIGRCPIVGPVSVWVKTHVLPTMTDIALSHDDLASLQADFWTWFLTRYDRRTTKVVVDYGYPVDTNFLLECQRLYPSQALGAVPFPLHELSSMFLGAGLNEHYDRRSFARMKRAVEHHPIHDATVTAACALRLWRLTSRRKR